MLAAAETRGDWETNKWWPSGCPRYLGVSLSQSPHLTTWQWRPPVLHLLLRSLHHPTPPQHRTHQNIHSGFVLSKILNIDRPLQEIIFDNSFWRRKTIIENITFALRTDGAGSFKNWNLPASALLTLQMFPLFAPREIQNIRTAFSLQNYFYCWIIFCLSSRSAYNGAQFGGVRGRGGAKRE